jgi:hypothetical protein
MIAADASEENEESLEQKAIEDVVDMERVLNRPRFLETRLF